MEPDEDGDTEVAAVVCVWEAKAVDVEDFAAATADCEVELEVGLLAKSTPVLL